MMRLKVICLLLLSFLTANLALPSSPVTGPAIAQSDRTLLRVMQWNIYYGKGTDELYDIERQVEWMVTLFPDIVFLNEVLPGEALRYQQMLASRTSSDWHAHHVPAQLDGTGNLILSRYAFVSTDSYRMQENGQYSRAVAQATIEVNGIEINLFSTHLDHRDETIRFAQVKELRKFLSRFPKPHILAGDLNAAPGTREIKKLKKGYVDAWEKALKTNAAFAYNDNPADWNTRTYRDRIDYVLYSKKPKSLKLEESVIPDLRDLSNRMVRKRLGTADDMGVRPSDHNLLVTTFIIGK